MSGFSAATADPSTSVRSGRDDNSVVPVRASAKKNLIPRIELSSRPERSVVEGPAVLSLLRIHRLKPGVAFFLIFSASYLSGLRAK